MNKKVKIVYVDLDGVLFNFIGGFSQVYDQDYSNLKKRNMAKHIGVTDEEWQGMLNMLGHDFWANLDLLPKAKQLIELIEKYKLKLYFASSPSDNPGSWSGKKAAIDTHFPKYSKRLILIKDKYRLAEQGVLLIDDAEYQVHNFLKHLGSAICYPKQYNFNKKYVGKELEQIESFLTFHSEPYYNE